MSDADSGAVAVVGMAGRFPKAPDTEAFWELLIGGGDAVGPVPPERWDPAEVFDATREIQRVGAFLEDIDAFDPAFFTISPREAEVLDPQQRLMLETTWRALEDAGAPAAGLRGSRTGVYVGGLWHDYELLRKDRGAAVTQHSIVGNSLDIVSSRVSYHLGLTGPSLTVLSSCSSSLVAVHQACQALRSGEIEGALVGGSNLMLTPEVTVGLTHFGGLSPTGRCHAFGAAADGFVRGEGVAVVYLKRLADALRAGDRIRAVVAASAVNNDGGGESLVTPHPAAQRDLLRRVYASGRVPLDRLAYVEAHGTGTARGDTAEAQALGEVLGAARHGRVLHIGSVKTNIGHLEPAAGLAGLVKAVLALEHGTVPPSLHARVPNPAIDFAGLNLAVARDPLPLEPGSFLGVNSFGWGGTNAHAVVTTLRAATARPPARAAEPPARAREQEPRTVREEPGAAERQKAGEPFLLPVSGHTPGALEERTRGLRQRLAAGTSAPELAQAMAWHRDHFAERCALLGPGLAEVARGRAGRRGKVAFVFPGQGAQWAGMGAGLYGRDAAFTRAMDRCAQALAPHAPRDVREMVTGGPAPRDVAEVQPALWAMSVSLAAAWRAAGVEPDVVVGHSQGEIAAATVAGVLTPEDGALVVCRRSDLLREIAGGGRMLAVDLDPEAARQAVAGFEGLVEPAVYNGPRSCVLSGDAESVLLLREILEADGVFCRLVEVDYGSHSPQVDPLLGRIREALAAVAPGPADTPLLSTVDLTWLDGPGADARYWAGNLRRPVRFAEAVDALIDEDVTHLVEVSPHPGLGAALRQLAQERPEPPVVLGTLRRDEGEHTDLLRAFAEAYVSGLPALGPRPARRPDAVPPPYPFQRERYWVVPGRHSGVRSGRLALTEVPSTAAGVWEGAVELDTGTHPWLADHRVHGTVLFPAGGFLALLHQALHGGAPDSGSAGHGTPVLRDVQLTGALAVGEDPVRTVLVWRPGPGDSGVLEVRSREEGATGSAPGPEAGAGARTRHCRATAARDSAPPTGGFPQHLLGAAPLDADGFYRDCAAKGLDYGPAFRPVTGGHVAEAASGGGREALVRLRLPSGSRSGALSGTPHPVLWDGVLQSALVVCDGPVLPRRVRRAAVAVTEADEVWVHARPGADGEVDLALFDAGQRPLGRLEGVLLAALPGGAGTSAETGRLTYRMRFVPRQRPATPAAEPGGAAGGGGLPGRVVARGRPGVLPDAAGEDLAGADTVVFVAPQDGRTGLLELAELVSRCAEENPSVRLAVVVRRGDPDAGLYPGFVAVVQAEYPQFGTRLIETDTFGAELMAELAAAEDRVVLSGGERLVGERVSGGSPAADPPWRSGTGARSFRLGTPRPGDLSALCARPLERPRPGPGQVEVAIEAASLNFIDVMKAMAVYPDDSPDRELLGLDCAGTVTAVGPGAGTVAVGDRVAACGFGVLASHALVEARHTARIPSELTATQAAALPMVLVTAWHALMEVARLEPGETVLVHSATGGLGLAALNVARLAGAEVLATAGTEEKREQLRTWGVEHVFDSRTLEWAEGVRVATRGRGVDVVLNSLPGAAIPLGLEALAEDGRFVEAGKRDIHQDTSVELGAFRKAVSFTAVDIAGLLRRRPERFASLLATVWARVTGGELGPLPVREMPFAEAQEAFRTLSRGRHTGKLVLTEPTGGGTVAVAPQPLPEGRFRAGGAYLITGGLGALGMSLAEYLAASGAGALALVGRSAPGDPARVEALRERGVRVGVWSADVADEGRMRTVLAEVRAQLPPLCGVFHAAGVLADATVANLDGALLTRVLRPKTDGARVLHELTAGDALDMFVLFSSAAAFVGTAGQAAYAAANSSLDALAAERRAAGLPALSVQWGPVAGTGLATGTGRGDRLAARGLGSLPPEVCWRALRHYLEADEAQVACLDLDPRRWLESYPAAAALASWQPLAAAGGTVAPTELRSIPAARRREVVEAEVRRTAAAVLRLAPEKLPPEVPLRALGLDSLMSLELRNRLEAFLGVRLSPTLLWKYGTLARLGPALSALVEADPEPEPVPEGGPEAGAGPEAGPGPRPSAAPAPHGAGARG
ncbi:SDR family NAD(P)-dependent oxidoreductase [Streptomyces sp. NPDC007063]|uniref:type I polyketide synthase n=1 Tax=Streptomyces sp. NPDC007063 TaxID=3364772 RepID=UPI00368F105D